MNSSVVPADRRTRRLLQQIDISTRRKLVPEFKTPEVVFAAGSNRSFAVQCSSLVRLVLPMVHLRGTGESSAKESFGLWGGGGNLSHTHTDVRLQPLVYDILPSTTAVFSYAIGSRNSSKFVINNSNYIRRLLLTMLLTPAQIKTKSFESRRKSLFTGMDAPLVYVHAWALGCLYSHKYPNRSEGADRVGGQLRGDKECPFSGVTKSGRVWSSN